MTLDDLYSEFDQLEDWEERCDFLMRSLGPQLQKLTPEEKTEKNLVHGCQSQVWLAARVEPGLDGIPRVWFNANSDSQIVAGLIAVVSLMYNGKTPREILDTDQRAAFKRLELDKQLFPARRNGLSGMVKRVKQIAAEALVTAG